MPRKLIHAINAFFLTILLIVLPAVTNLKLLSWQVRSPEMQHRFTMVGFGAALFFNLSLVTIVKMRKSRRILCVKWAFVQAMLALVFLLMWRDILNFDWLKL